MSSTGQSILIIVLLVLNAIAAIAYYVLNVIVKQNREKSIVIRAVVMLICPVVGPLFVLLSFVLYKVFMSEPVDLEDVIFSKERIRFELKADEEKERNIVPLEEAIAVSERDDLRRLVMNLVSSNASESLASLTLALDSEDSETSHYAASVLQEMLNNFRVEVETQYRRVLDGDERRVAICEYLIEYMDNYLSQKVFIDLEQRNYVEIMENVCDIYYENAEWAMTGRQYEMISLRLLEIEDYRLCEKWCMRAREHFPDQLSTYTCLLKLYFNSRQKDYFFETIEELKNSSVVIDSETLEMIRVFS